MPYFVLNLLQPFWQRRLSFDFVDQGRRVLRSLAPSWLHPFPTISHLFIRTSLVHKFRLGVFSPIESLLFLGKQLQIGLTDHVLGQNLHIWHFEQLFAIGEEVCLQNWPLRYTDEVCIVIGQDGLVLT